ncbi:MAG: hypothetical protein DMD63_09555 [Gemmatimonadetes bacterium]|nr:MAG: hypothetical protein DMD63_09555 [Gemmatimonadota bacterium]
MTISRKTLVALTFLMAGLVSLPACAQIELPRTAPTAGRDSGKPEPGALVRNAPLELRADLRARILTASQGGSTLRTYSIAIGQPKYPTPPGIYMIRKIVWNPSWKPPPGSDWAKGKTEKGPGDPGNPMKVVKIFFKEPDYYIHGTDDVESLGGAESHGCLRMDPGEVADLAKMVMEHGGQPRGENWFWRVIHFRRQEQVVYIDEPVSLVISD